eukprot:Skav215281  [mRNA]  locus=scaffold2522:101338:103142:- [translate_table: standard]
MCQAACYKPDMCDNYIDPAGYIGLDSKAAEAGRGTGEAKAPLAGSRGVASMHLGDSVLTLWRSGHAAV